MIVNVIYNYETILSIITWSLIIFHSTPVSYQDQSFNALCNQQLFTFTFN